MSYQQVIVALLLGIVISFTSGFVIGRLSHNEPRIESPLPANYDVAQAAAQARASEEGLKACYALMGKQIEAIAAVKVACNKREEMAH